MQNKVRKRTYSNAALSVNRGGTDKTKSFLTTAEAAKYLGLTSKQLENLRSHNKGPHIYKREKNRCYYHDDALDSWLANRRKKKKGRAVYTTKQALKKLNPDASYAKTNLYYYKQSIEEYKNKFLSNSHVANSFTRLVYVLDDLMKEIETLKRRK